MAKRRRVGLLGELETRVMRAVWSSGPATVRQVHAALSVDRELAYTTVLATMRNLERKGFLAREAQGRGHVYRDRVGERAVARSAVRELLERLFGGDEVRFASALFDRASLSPAEFEKLRKEILELQRQEEEGR